MNVVVERVRSSCAVLCLSQVSTLQVLNLAGCKQLTDEALIAVVRANAGLRDLNVALCVDLSHDALAVRTYFVRKF